MTACVALQRGDQSPTNSLAALLRRYGERPQQARFSESFDRSHCVDERALAGDQKIGPGDPEISGRQPTTLQERANAGEIQVSGRTYQARFLAAGRG